MKKTTILSVFFIGLFLGCTSEVLQSDLSEKDNILEIRGKKFVPFKGSVETNGTFAQSGEGRCASINPLYLTLGYEGTGNVTHMGKIKLYGSQCVDPTGVVLDPSRFVDDRFTLVAANGDELYGYGATGGAFPTDDPLVFTVEEDYIITGGTGRFKNAQGYGKAPGIVRFLHFPPRPDDPQLPGSNIFDGVIAY